MDDDVVLTRGLDEDVSVEIAIDSFVGVDPIYSASALVHVA